MNTALFLLCWSPVLLLTVLAVVFRRPALALSIWGCLFTFALVVFAFDTRVGIAFLSALDGVFTTLPLLLVIFAGILLSSLLMSTGSLARIVTWLKGAAGDAFGRNLLITLGVGNFMEGAGVIAEPVVAPMLHAAGVSPKGSAALSIVGYAGLMTLEMAGIIVTVLSLVTGIPVKELGVASAWLSIPATLIMALCVPLFLPKPAGGSRRIATAGACGLFLGFTALACAAWVGVSISGTVAGLVMIAVFILFGPGGLRLYRTVAVDLAPFAFMLAALLAVNTVPALKTLTFEKLVIEVAFVPVHTITFRPLFSAYLYLFAAFALAAMLLQVPAEQLRSVLRGGFSKGWRAFVAMGLFGAMGQMIAYSGYGADFAAVDSARNIPFVLSEGLKTTTGSLYPVFVPLLGWVGTFLTGYGVASLMLFGQLQVQASGLLGISATWLSAGLAVGASLGSISSPFKIALATPMCNAVGKEGAILRLTIPLGIGASFLVGLVLWLVV
jgi:lactate permease